MISDLIRPTKKGPELLAEIRDERPAPGSLTIWWLGQSGYVIKSRSGTLVVDPYLSEHLTAKYAGTNKPHIRMTEAPFRGHELRDVDLILSSHKHSDHLDPGTMPELMAASPSARLALPAALLDNAASMDLPTDRTTGLVAGETIECAGYRVRAIPSAHEGLDTDDLGRHLYLGFVIEAEGVRLYHSGDTLVYDGLVEQLGDAPFDVMFLPINGRDPRRGVSGNMNANEAVSLASVVRPRFVVPHHYDMFTFNTVPVSEFEAEAARLPEGVAAKVLRCGQRWEINAWV